MVIKAAIAEHYDRVAFCSTVKAPRSTYGAGRPCYRPARYLVSLAVRTDDGGSKVYFEGYACQYCVRSYRRLANQVIVNIQKL
jgi:hypothetical protein